MDNRDESNDDRLRRLRDVQRALTLANEQANLRLAQELRARALLCQEVERVKAEAEKQNSEKDLSK